MTYNSQQLRQLFQQPFQIDQWKALLTHFFHLSNPRYERIDGTTEPRKGYYMGCLEADNFRLGFFVYEIEGSVSRSRVALRQLTRSFINPTWGLFDAAIAVFNDGTHWRLSFISDLKGEATAPKRYTFLFGDPKAQYNTAVGRFLQLQTAGISYDSLKEAFSVEALTKQFYADLFGWYQWAVSPEAGVTFPNDTATEDDDREGLDLKVIRLITRLMFVWFIKQKHLVPAKLFNANAMAAVLKAFDPMSTTNGCYYNAILQNLFFATLNRAITDDEGHHRGFAQTTTSQDVKTLYRYAELFTISQDEVIGMFAEVPFLNGGLFECLDKTRTLDGVERAYYYDGFSRNDKTFADGRYKHRAVVPNVLFFHPEQGLFAILSRYNFTIEENTPNEQLVALDPELLGKVFENLLGAYNPETQETARNQSGSFYTPREIVSYMVDESLMAYLGKTPDVEALFSDDFTPNPAKSQFYKEVAEKLRRVKVLDPACGSGAFPMGLLNRLVDLLQKVEPATSVYQLKLQIIENCVYGSDIQSIAAQITKLRFFISLICDCERHNDQPNYGIPTLPNLETKFVAADTLIAQKKRDQQLNLFEDPEVEKLKQQLQSVRHQHFKAKSYSQKVKLRLKDRELRLQLAQLLEDDNNIERADAVQLAAWNPYDQNAVASFFDPEWMFGVTGGFDIVIGNPPYIQLQNNSGVLAERYTTCNYCTFKRTGDIYCLFYERGLQLLKSNGHLCFITSNKWMRAGYGAPTRNYFTTHANPKLLIDFAGVKVFESATVDTNILLLQRANNQHRTLCAVTSKQQKDSISNLSLFVQQHAGISNFTGDQAWTILSPIEQSIKQKIEAVGTPLKDWDIQINYGIKTGCNEAFIISTERRNEILAACQTPEERRRTEEIIRPILRGRDIKRYSYEWANLYLIFVPWHFPLHLDPSIKGCSIKAENAFKEQYPAVYTHLLQYKDVLSKRNKAETGIRYEWYALQRWGANYWEDFAKPKVVWKRVGSILRFSYDEKNHFALDSTCFATGFNVKYLCCVLNSPMGHYMLKDAPKTGTGDLLISVQAVEPVRVPKLRDTAFIDSLFDQRNEVAINHFIYQLYNLDLNEMEYIESREA